MDRKGMDPLAPRVAARFLAMTPMLDEPIVHDKPPGVTHTFENSHDGMVAYVWSQHGKFNVRLDSVDDGDARVVAIHKNYPTEAAAIVAAKKMVGNPHREIHSK